MGFLILLLLGVCFELLAFDKIGWLDLGFGKKIDFCVYSLLAVFFIFCAADVLWKGWLV